MKDCSQNICIKCGLCCDGTLFSYAYLKDSETLTSPYLFRTFILQEGRKAFKLPCCYLKDKKCSIYNNRPYSICAEFKCKLLNAVENGETTYSDAIAIVDETITLKEKVELKLSQRFPQLISESLNTQKKDFDDIYKSAANSRDFRKENGDILIDIMSLNKSLSSFV